MVNFATNALHIPEGSQQSSYVQFYRTAYYTYLSPHSTRQGFAPSLTIVEGTAVNVKALVST